MKKHFLSALLGTCFAFGAFGASVAHAEQQQITLEADKSIMLAMSERPGTVVVGNPSIADVSINSNTIFLHGHSFGNTNIIVLDGKGNQLADFDVTVKVAKNDALTLLTVRPLVTPGQYKYSYSCSPTCERAYQIMDTDFKELSDSMKVKSELATGSQTSEASAPSAAQ